MHWHRVRGTPFVPSHASAEIIRWFCQFPETPKTIACFPPLSIRYGFAAWPRDPPLRGVNKLAHKTDCLAPEVCPPDVGKLLLAAIRQLYSEPCGLMYIFASWQGSLNGMPSRRGRFKASQMPLHAR